VCYREEQYIPASAASDRSELELIGYLAGMPSEHVLDVVDPLEDGSGVVVRQHPRILLAESPELLHVVDEFQIGARRKVTTRDRARLSNWHIVAILIMAAAHGREQKRELDRMRQGAQS
jgi:hypothetical protein